MQSSRVLLVCILLTMFSIFLLPSVHAQTTQIIELRHPTGVLAGGMDPFTVQAVISFQDAKPNSSLIVNIVDLDSTPQHVVLGIVTTASPYECVNQTALQASCLVNLRASSGSENLEFQVGGLLGGQPLRIGTWDLNMTAGLLDSNNTLIPASVSSVPFGVQLTPLELTVNVPNQVTVIVDGIEQHPGSVTVGVVDGDHNLSVSPIAQIDSGKRLRFDTWSDGFTEPNRTVTLHNDTAFEAVYAIQYKLTLESDQGNVSGQGWYDANSTQTFSVSQVEAEGGLLGLLGGKLIFQGWTENGELLTNSTSGSILMNEPHTLTAQWQSDYSTPIAIVATVVIIAMVAAWSLSLLIRKRTASRQINEVSRAPSHPAPKRSGNKRRRLSRSKSTTRRKSRTQ